MRLTFVSTNAGKFREVREVLGDYGVDVRWSRRPLPELQATDLETVVAAKLSSAQERAKNVLVEDSGLFVPALHGFPGVYSAYVLDTLGLPGILQLLDGRDRRARFETVAGLALGRRRWTRTGECHGTIAPEPRGGQGFGYDPIFIPEGDTRTFGEMTPIEKNRQSHRARAMRRIGLLLKALS